MKQRLFVPIISVFVIVGGLLAWSLIKNNNVLLGLDLKGGAEVVLEPAVDTELEGEYLREALDRSVEIIRNRVDALGVAEPDITRQSNRIVVQLSGVEDQQRALDVVGQTAELRFRPVCGNLPAVPINLETGEEAQTSTTPEEGQVSDRPVGITPSDRDESTSENSSDNSETESVGETTTMTPAGTGCENLGFPINDALSMPTTTPEDDDSEMPVILPEKNEAGEITGRLLLGRTMLTGAALETADATFDGFEWSVRPTFRSGEDGIDLFNAAASVCFNMTAVCQTGRLAIVLDGVIESAPNVNTPYFERDSIVISGNFDQGRAEETAVALRYGSLPLEFETPSSRIVSATLGQDSFDAGVIAGIVGLMLVALFMFAYYRLLGVAAILSLALSGTMLWIVLAWLSTTQSLALTLAGVVGLIVSIGTSLDSNVVYFEHLKEDIKNGRTLQSAVDQSFPVAFKTIFWANLASLIGAGVLYFLTVGSVRGFALMLGLASILDLLATYFFLRPFVKWISSFQNLNSRYWLYGLSAPDEGDAS
jgi:preprotein translocase subunit SecD